MTMLGLCKALNTSTNEGLFEEINEGIKRYNKKIEYVKLRYYYLVVIREAIGFRNHKWIEKIYKIPEKKKLDGQI